MKNDTYGMMSGNDFDGVQDFENNANDENVSPNVNPQRALSKSPRSFKKLLVSDDDSLLPNNAISYLQKVR